MSESRLLSSPAALAGFRRVPALRARVESTSGWFWVGLLTAISAVGRGLASLQHETARLFPDEYIYASLARSLSHGELAIRGTTELFPALLQPLLTAPLWLTGDVATAYALTQWVHAIAMSLSAVPVYLLSRRLGLPTWQGVAAAAFTLALPVLLFSSFITADAVALPLALAALAVGVRALVQPAKGSQAGFLALAALASFTRVQYVILVPAFVVAALFMSGGRPVRAARRYWLVAVVLVIPLLGGLALGPRAILGYYGGVFDLNVSVTGIGHWIAVDLMLTAYASGWILVPAALIGLVGCLVRPETPEQKAFGALVSSFALFLLIEAALYASNGSDRFQERYLMAVLPLVPLAFSVGMRRQRSWRTPIIAVSALMLAIPLAVPLSGYAVGSGSQDSPFLQGLSRLASLTGGYGSASLLVAVLASALAVLASAAARWPRLGTPAALAVAIAVSVVGSAAATSFDRSISHGVRTQNLPPDASWVDHLAPGAAMLLAPGSSRPLAATHLFWNTSIDRVLVMAGSTGLDEFGSYPAAIDRDGRLVVEGRPLQGPVLVEEFGSTINLVNATRITSLATTTLWQAGRDTRVQALAVGRYADGWLDRRTAISVWPSARGHSEEMRTVLSLPDWATRPALIEVRTDGLPLRHVTVRPGKSVVLRIPVRPAGETRTYLTSVGATLYNGTRSVAAMSSRPTVVAVPQKR